MNGDPDYTLYTLAELHEARDSINVRKYAERTRKLDLLIRDREAVEYRRLQLRQEAEPQRVSIADEEGRIASVKAGRGVSFGRGISEIVGSILFCILWVSGTIAIGGFTGTAFMIFGVFVCGSGVIAGIFHLYNAFADKRFSEHDIVSPDKEPDPFARFIGKE